MNIINHILNIQTYLKKIAAGFILILTCSGLWSATYVWTGTTGDGNWTSSGNWSSNDGGSSYPGSDDTVIINTSSADVTITIPDNTSVKGFLTYGQNACTITSDNKLFSADILFIGSSANTYRTGKGLPDLSSLSITENHMGNLVIGGSTILSVNYLDTSSWVENPATLKNKLTLSANTTMNVTGTWEAGENTQAGTPAGEGRLTLTNNGFIIISGDVHATDSTQQNAINTIIQQQEAAGNAIKPENGATNPDNTYYWNGATADWSTAANWIPNTGYPNAADSEVIILKKSINPEINEDISIKTIVFSPDTTLEIKTGKVLTVNTDFILSNNISTASEGTIKTTQTLSLSADYESSFLKLNCEKFDCDKKLKCNSLTVSSTAHTTSDLEVTDTADFGSTVTLDSTAIFGKFISNSHPGDIQFKNGGLIKSDTEFTNTGVVYLKNVEFHNGNAASTRYKVSHTSGKTELSGTIQALSVEFSEVSLKEDTSVKTTSDFSLKGTTDPAMPGKLSGSSYTLTSDNSVTTSDCYTISIKELKINGTGKELINNGTLNLEKTVISGDVKNSISNIINISEDSTISKSLTNSGKISIYGDKKLTLNGNIDDSAAENWNFNFTGTIILSDTQSQTFSPSENITYENITINKFGGSVSFINKPIKISNLKDTETTKADISFNFGGIIKNDTTLLTIGNVIIPASQTLTICQSNDASPAADTYRNFYHQYGTTTVNGTLNAANINLKSLKSSGTVTATLQVTLTDTTTVTNSATIKGKSIDAKNFETSPDSAALTLIASEGSFTIGNIGTQTTKFNSITMNSESSNFIFDAQNSKFHTSECNILSQENIELSSLNLSDSTTLNFDTQKNITLKNIETGILSYLSDPTKIFLSGTIKITKNGESFTIPGPVTPSKPLIPVCLKDHTTITSAGSINLYDNITCETTLYNLTVQNAGVFTLYDAAKYNSPPAVPDPANITTNAETSVTVRNFQQTGGTGSCELYGDISASETISFTSPIVLKDNVLLSSNGDQIFKTNSSSITGTPFSLFCKTTTKLDFQYDTTLIETGKLYIDAIDTTETLSLKCNKLQLNSDFLAGPAVSKITVNGNIYLSKKTTSNESIFGNDGKQININGNLIIAKDTQTIQKVILNSPVVCTNFVLYSGDLRIQENLKTTGDIIFLGSAYSTKDTYTGAEEIYTYDKKPAHWSQPSYNSGSWETAPLVPSQPFFTGTVTVDSGKILHVGKNFYANGSSLNGTAEWFIDIQNNTRGSVCFAEAYNTSVTNSTVRCHNGDGTTVYEDSDKAQIVFEPGEAAAICDSSCKNWDTQEFELQIAFTRRDNSIFAGFNHPVRNSTQELNGENSILSFINHNVSDTAPKFLGSYSEPDCINLHSNNITDLTTIDGINYYGFYLKSEDSWNTDATGTSPGNSDNRSTDRKGIHKSTVPYLDIPRTSGTNHYIITDIFGKRLKPYTGDARFTNVTDKTGPVLYSVRTGQENHNVYKSSEGSASQPSYDSHNFLEFRYSERVNFGDSSIGGTIVVCNNTNLSSEIWLPAEAATLTNNFADTQNIRTRDSFAALTNQINQTENINLKGLGTIAFGKLFTGSNGTADKYVNACYRTDSYSIRLSVAGYTDGTINDRSNNEYKKWIGYIEQAIQPSGLVTMDSQSNSIVTDCALAIDGITPVYNPQEKYTLNQTNPEINKVFSTGADYPNESVYGNWDISSPAFAPLRLDNTIQWAQGSYCEAVGTNSGIGSTLDKIEFHLFDNTPSYSSEDSAIWLSEKGWCINEDNDNPALYDSNYTYCADIIGGSRQFSSDATNRTTGGIRFSSLAESSKGFKYIDIQTDGAVPDKNFVSTIDGIHTGAKASLFVGSSNKRRSPTDPDGLYFGLGLSDLSYPITKSFTVSYDETKAYVTDLAGNRLRSSTIRTIDRTPPSIDIVLSPVGQKEIYIVFVKKLVLENSKLKYISNDGKSISINETIETLLPKCFDIISIDENSRAKISNGLQIDTSVPAAIIPIKSEKNELDFTAIKLTLTQNITLESVEKMYIRLKAPEGYPEFTQDPITSIKNSRVTMIQDKIGNYVQMYDIHSLSDFAISSVNPLYAYDNDMIYNNEIIMNGFYQEDSWAVHNWNQDQKNYGTLPANHPYEIVAEINNGTNQSDFIPSGVRIYLSANPIAKSISKQYNADMNKNLRIWLPEVTNGIFPALSVKNNPVQNYFQTDSRFTNSEDTPMKIQFSIPKEVSQAWGSDQQISFLFGLLDENGELLRIYPSPYHDVSTESYDLSKSDALPLYALRLTDPTDITSIDLWSFKTRNITEQRGGVTILNNVINPVKGEKTVIKINMPEEGKLNVMVMTLDGNIITYLNHGTTTQGEHYFSWNGKNKNNHPVARGMYFIRVTGSGFDETRKVLVVKED